MFASQAGGPGSIPGAGEFCRSLYTWHIPAARSTHATALHPRVACIESTNTIWTGTITTGSLTELQGRGLLAYLLLKAQRRPCATLRYEFISPIQFRVTSCFTRAEIDHKSWLCYPMAVALPVTRWSHSLRSRTAVISDHVGTRCHLCSARSGSWSELYLRMPSTLNIETLARDETPCRFAVSGMHKRNWPHEIRPLTLV